MSSIVYNMDCLEAMRKMPDNAFDLAVVDPPYGAGFTETGGCKGWFAKYHQNTPENQGGGWNRFGQRFDRYKHESITFTAVVERKSENASHFREQEIKPELQTETRTSEGNVKKIISWDVAPKQEYFEELFRISRNQIIWGGNYFDLPPTRCFIVWRKTNIPEKGFTMSAVEYAWTSFWRNAEVIDCNAQGRKDDERFHPTQKPIYLYAEIFNRFAKKGDKILDTHLGSGSSRIAAYDAGLDFVGFEIDKVYFDKAEERFQKHISQLDLFHLDEAQEDTEQMQIFDFLEEQ